MQCLVTDTSVVDAQINADRVSIEIIPNACYYGYEVPGGNVYFTTGKLTRKMYSITIVKKRYG
jgi:hypothetical protein